MQADSSHIEVFTFSYFAHGSVNSVPPRFGFARAPTWGFFGGAGLGGGAMGRPDPGRAFCAGFGAAAAASAPKGSRAAVVVTVLAGDDAVRAVAAPAGAGTSGAGTSGAGTS